MSTAFDSDSYMGRSSGRMPPKPTWCPACKTEHVTPVAWTSAQPCPQIARAVPPLEITIVRGVRPTSERSS